LTAQAQAEADALTGIRVLDLTETHAAYAGRLLADLAAASDAVIEAPASPAGAGIDFEAMHRRTSALIVVSVTPFGRGGPHAGHAATDLTLLAAGGLLALGALERLCESHDVYRWLCGGVSTNYHTLADFRVGCADLLDRLLSEHLAALAKAGLVDLDTLAQDGVRIRASAGAASFRREPTLERHLATAQAVVEELKREVDARSDASNQRIKAAKERAARERGERVKAAQTALAEIKRQRQEREDPFDVRLHRPADASTIRARPRARKLRKLSG
jgi:DNA-binding transcriptional ArsR family regulator